MAYVDPGAGSIALQLAVAAVAAGVFFVRNRWTRITATIRSRLSRFTRPR